MQNNMKAVMILNINNEISSPEQKIITILNDSDLVWLQEKTHKYMTLMSYYKCAMMEIETKLKVLNEEFSLNFDRNPISSIKTRLKTPVSIKNKLENLGYKVSVDAIEQHLNDVAGIRVVCSFVEDVYSIAKALLKQDDIKLITAKDYIQSPKENGYRSLHLIVEIPIYLSHHKKTMKVEIQLRTIAMDFWASLEHQLNYKKNHVLTDKMKEELLLCAQISAELDEKMDDLRKELC